MAILDLDQQLSSVEKHDPVVRRLDWRHCMQIADVFLANQGAFSQCCSDHGEHRLDTLAVHQYRVWLRQFSNALEDPARRGLCSDRKTFGRRDGVEQRDGAGLRRLPFDVLSHGRGPAMGAQFTG